MSHRARTVARTCAVSMAALILVGVGSGFDNAPPPVEAPAKAAAPAPAAAFIQGDVRTDVFRVARGERVMAVSNVCIYAKNEVVIDGLLLSKPGVTIEIVAPKLTVRGAMRAGSGANGTDVLEPGGNGGSIILRVPDITVAEGAVVRAGAGGDGGFGASGGKGGDILLLPSSQARGDGEGSMEAGAGGEGGESVNGYNDAARNGGSGGAGGSVGVVTTKAA